MADHDATGQAVGARNTHDCRRGSAYSARPSPSSSARVWPAPRSSAIVAAAGVAHGTFFFHFPSKEHVLLELESREEARIAAEFARFLDSPHDLASALTEVVRPGDGPRATARPAALQRNTRAALLADRGPTKDEWTDHPVIVLLVARDRAGATATVRCIRRWTRSTARRSSCSASTEC